MSLSNLGGLWQTHLHACAYCGNIHKGVCPRVASIEYHPGGGVKRVTFHDEKPLKLIGREEPNRSKLMERTG